MLRSKRSLVLAIAMFAVLLAALAACTPNTAQQMESQRQQSSYDFLVYNQPAHAVKYSSTRNLVNFWIDTWGCSACQGKLAFVYLLAANGQQMGYYVSEGLPVSYCALLTPDYQVRQISGVKWMVKAPSMDGVYYSGGQCSQVYMKDAVKGKYMEFTAGGSLNYLLYEEPGPLEVEPLGFTKIEDVWDAETGQAKEAFQPREITIRPPPEPAT